MTDTATPAPATGIPLRKRSGCMCSELGPEPHGHEAPPAPAPYAGFDEDTIARVVAFHGHMCPGLAMGMQASAIALREIGAHSRDEEVVAVVETDMCGVDGIQFLTGCTFGKGNLIHRDWGKNAYTFYRRSDGKAIRMRGRKGAFERNPEHQELFAKVRAGTATAEERERFGALHVESSRRVLALDPLDLFEVSLVEGEPPRKARIHASIACEDCGEEAMETRVHLFGGRKLCTPCFEAATTAP
ncbi:MAG TPA: FmdE family protein [Acidimicrobiales bacterium]|nr:FmdE family protein [Acidimicrobiales bacterium]